MKTRAIILAGGEGSRLGILTAKRTKPAVPFGGKYRIIDFTLSNCANSGIFDVMVLAQYRPHSLIEHIGSGVPWDLDRNFTGGASILTPYKARGNSDWYMGTADAVQQNFLFIKRGSPEQVLILSGDHIYAMNYQAMINYHIERQADLTIAAIRVPLPEASRFGIMGVEEDKRVVSFLEKPAQPPSDLANMGVYLFNTATLDRVLWEDHNRSDSAHDFGKNILPRMVEEGKRVFAFPYEGYWVDVGTVNSYWSAHMDLLAPDPSINLSDRSWIIHTRTEERSPVRIAAGAEILDSMISDGCVIAPGAHVERSVLSPGVRVGPGALVFESVLLTDTYVDAGAVVEHAITDKKVYIGENARLGERRTISEPMIAMVGKNSRVPAGMVVEAGAVIGADVVEQDYRSQIVQSSDYITTSRLPYEI